MLGRKFLKLSCDKFKKDHRGNILLFALIFGSISFTVIVMGVAGYAIMENRASVRKHNRELAFQIADAGINYYRWHLAHDKSDYYDGNTSSTPGPYVHEYRDKDDNITGYYSLEIIPPTERSNVVIVESTGWTTDQPESRRTIRARIGFPSFTDFTFITNSDVWIGDDEEVRGKFHANGGIRFDGLTDAPITSAMATYTCKIFHGCGNLVKPGIWGDGGPEEYWSFPVPAKDFNIITAELAQIKEEADNGGIYLSSSGAEGWRLEFTSDAKVKAYKVKTTSCYRGKTINDNNYYWFCIDIATLGAPVTYDLSSTTLIYVNDNTWVDGVVNGRVTVGTSQGKSIIINGNITYLAKDGNHVLGLVGEQNVFIPYNSPQNLEVDAAMLAQKGAVMRYYYPGDTKDTITVYGSIITSNIWTFSWVSGGGSIVSGYNNSEIVHDENLAFSAPPAFPTGFEYVLISWEEVQ